VILAGWWARWRQIAGASNHDRASPDETACPARRATLIIAAGTGRNKRLMTVTTPRATGAPEERSGGRIIRDRQRGDEVVEGLQRVVEGDERASNRPGKVVIALSRPLHDSWFAKRRSGDGHVTRRRLDQQELGDPVRFERRTVAQDQGDVQQVLRAPAIADGLLQESPELFGDDVVDVADAESAAVSKVSFGRRADGLIQADLDRDDRGAGFATEYSLTEAGFIGQRVANGGLERDEGSISTGRLLLDTLHSCKNIEIPINRFKCLDERITKKGGIDEVCKMCHVDREVEIERAPVRSVDEVERISTLDEDA
jgi:hypothetical protein